MEDIASSIWKTKNNGQLSLIPFLTAGYPNIDITEEIISCLIEEKLVSTIEIGIPFSDPIAEGKTIQKSSSIALKNGIGIEESFKMIDKINSSKNSNDNPLVVMGYYNPILKMGTEEFFKSANNVGIKGVIIADIPNKELEKLQSLANENQIETIPLVPLNSDESRIKHACNIGQGFMYCVSVMGVTGSRDSLSPLVENKVNEVRKFTSLPVAVGFGISKPSHIESLSKFADAAIIGSAIINVISESKVTDIVDNVKSFISKLKKSSNISL